MIYQKALRVGAFLASFLLFPAAAALAAGISDVVNEVSQSAYTDFLANRLYTHSGDNRGNGPQHDLARSYIFNTFAGLGLNPVLDPFQYNGSTYNNVVATLPGTVHPDEIYIIGAHYDSVNNPGADDNASGVAGVLEAASILARHRLGATVVFIAFDREEQGLIGSKAYANSHLDYTSGMVSLDMIAYNPSGGHHDKAWIYGRTASDPIKNDLAAAMAAYGNGITAEIGGDTPYSDHAPFEANGDQACLLIEHAVWDNPNYHKAVDTVDTAGYIDYAYGTKMTKSVVGWLATQADLVPTVNGTWKATASGSWNNPGNWNGGIPYYAGDTAAFTLETVAPAVVTLDSPAALSALSFNNTHGYALVPSAPGNRLTLSNAGAPVPLTVAAGAHSIAADLILNENLSVGTALGTALSISGSLTENAPGRSLIKTGPGDLILSGTNSYSGATDIQEGLLTLDGGDLADTSAISVAAGATFELAAGQAGVGVITGQGSTIVSGAAALSAPSITQDTLSIGSNPKRTPALPVPEPSVLLLLALAALSAACVFLGIRKVKPYPIAGG
jgi:autotransporter-associated beta strand protein